MKITKISTIIAIIIGIGFLYMNIPFDKQTLYFMPLIIIVNLIRIWEKAKKQG